VSEDSSPRPTQSDLESVSDDEMELDFGDDEFTPASAPAPNRRRQPSPPPPIARRPFPWAGQQDTGTNPLAAMMGMDATGFRGMGGMLGGMGSGFHPSAGIFRRNYNAYSMAILEVQQGRGGYSGRENAMYGGKSALDSNTPDCAIVCADEQAVVISHYAGVRPRHTQ
jgi:hypothetical protein